MGYYIVYCLLVILFCGIFIPDGIDGEINNLPLLILIISVLLITLLVKLALYIKIFAKAKHHLIKNGYEIQGFSLLPSLLRKNKAYHIIAKKNDDIYKILILSSSKYYLTHHFESVNLIELYKSTRLTIKPNVRQANIISGHVDTKMVGKRKLHWNDSDFENATCIILFNKLPCVVKDSLSRTNLDNGDKICNKALLYDFNGFVRNIH